MEADVAIRVMLGVSNECHHRSWSKFVSNFGKFVLKGFREVSKCAISFIEGGELLEMGLDGWRLSGNRTYKHKAYER